MSIEGTTVGVKKGQNGVKMVENRFSQIDSESFPEAWKTVLGHLGVCKHSFGCPSTVLDDAKIQHVLRPGMRTEQHACS